MEKNEVVLTTQSNEVTLPNGFTKMNTNLFGNGKSNRITNLDLSDEEISDAVLNSSQEADFKLNDEIEKEIEVIGCVLTQTPKEVIDEETGEVKTGFDYSMCLFDKDLKSHVTGSNSCYYSFCQIISLKGVPTKDNPLILIPIKAPAKEKGHFHLRLKIKSNK